MVKQRKFDITHISSTATTKRDTYTLVVNIRFCVGPSLPKEVFVLKPTGHPENAERELLKGRQEAVERHSPKY